MLKPSVAWRKQKYFFYFLEAVLVILDGVEAALSPGANALASNRLCFCSSDHPPQTACLRCYVLAMSVQHADITHVERQLAVCRSGAKKAILSARRQRARRRLAASDLRRAAAAYADANLL